MREIEVGSSELSDVALEIFDDLPAVLGSFLKEFFVSLKVRLPSDASAILIGSTARRELTWRIDHGKLILVGDIEFIVYAPREKKNMVISITREVISYHNRLRTDEIGYIDIDFGVLDVFSRLKLVKGIWLFECQSAGKLIFGDKNPFEKMTPIDVTTIDMESVDYLILVRLWNTYKSLSSLGVTPVQRDEIYKRNILDVLTVYLPRIGVLSCGYFNRLRVVEQLRFDDLFLKKYYPVFKSTTEWKLGLNKRQVTHDWASSFVEMYDFLNSTRPPCQRPSISFYIRSKLMTFYFFRSYLELGVVQSFTHSIFTKYNAVEKALLVIMFAIHRYESSGQRPSAKDTELRSACDFVNLKHDVLLTELRCDKIYNGKSAHVLDNIMRVWFYGRSPNRK